VGFVLNLGVAAMLGPYYPVWYWYPVATPAAPASSSGLGFFFGIGMWFRGKVRLGLAQLAPRYIGKGTGFWFDPRPLEIGSSTADNFFDHDHFLSRAGLDSHDGPPGGSTGGGAPAFHGRGAPGAYSTGGARGVPNRKVAPGGSTEGRRQGFHGEGAAARFTRHPIPGAFQAGFDHGGSWDGGAFGRGVEEVFSARRHFGGGFHGGGLGRSHRFGCA